MNERNLTINEILHRWISSPDIDQSQIRLTNYITRLESGYLGLTEIVQTLLDDLDDLEKSHIELTRAAEKLHENLSDLYRRLEDTHVTPLEDIQDKY